MTLTFQDLVSTWLQTVAAIEMKPSGYRSYESICRLHLVPAFGDLAVDDITPNLIERFAAQKIAAGMSSRTVTNHLHVIRRLLSYAHQRGLAASPPVQGVTSPRQEPDAYRIRYLNPEQLQLLVEATPDSWRVLIAMAFMCGLRKGEQLSTTFRDISFEHRTISVSKTIKGGVVTSPKTPWSIGVIPLPESLVPLLEERRRNAPDPDGLIFCRRDGSPLPDGLPNSILAKALEKAGLPRVTWHEMSRHSWVVAHLQAGTDIPTLQRLGRWKTADVLLNTYAHVLPSSGGDAVRRLEDVIKLGG